MIVLKMLSKTGCSLCDQQKFILKRIKQRQNIKVLVELIDNSEHYKQYINKVPVILLNEEEISIYKVNEGQINQRINELKEQQQ